MLKTRGGGVSHHAFFNSHAIASFLSLARLETLGRRQDGGPLNCMFKQDNLFFWLYFILFCYLNSSSISYMSLYVFVSFLSKDVNPSHGRGGGGRRTATILDFLVYFHYIITNLLVYYFFLNSSYMA